MQVSLCRDAYFCVHPLFTPRLCSSVQHWSGPPRVGFLLQIFVFVYFSTQSNSVTFIFTKHMLFFSVWAISISKLCWLLFLLCLDLPSFYSSDIQFRLSVCLFTGLCKECKNYNTLFAIVRLVFFDRRRYVCVTRGVWSLISWITHFLLLFNILYLTYILHEY